MRNAQSDSGSETFRARSPGHGQPYACRVAQWAAIASVASIVACSEPAPAPSATGFGGTTTGTMGLGGSSTTQTNSVVSTGGTAASGTVVAGGMSASGGTGPGSAAGAGGASQNATGGVGVGGRAAGGGAALGGIATGGAADVPAGNGGVSTGGTATGGRAIGGSTTGGALQGGASTGGAGGGRNGSGGTSSGGVGGLGDAAGGVVGLGGTAAVLADNPLFKTFGCADPAPIVHGDTFYILCGEDVRGNTDFNMYQWRLLSSTDMGTWVDLGVILKASDVSWIPDNRAFASQIVYRNGTFYFYASGDGQIGVLRSTKITGPWEDVNKKPFFTRTDPGAPQMTIDPTVLVDDDGRAYIFYGMGGCRWAELNEDMISLKTTAAAVTAGLTNYFEAPWIMKANSTYFLIYAYGGWPSQMAYSTSRSPTGPWTFGGVIGKPTGKGTNHAGVAYFKGQWWYVYHTEELSKGVPYDRAVCVDKLTITGSTIQPITYTSFWM